MNPQLDIEKRLPVWTVLSELFLDTSFDDADYDRIATVLNESPYRKSELEHILREEVSPAFGGNLFSIAGEWAPWSKDEVQAIMEKSLRQTSSSGLLSWVRKRMTPRPLPHDWHSIASRLS
ncbi:hypothetical protein SLG_06780 [Sphingobium sp. SYK-6]|uniref:DUF7079 family protein n=1 Tax=Sphingobium sp. (strain NBRC 103272 / SYK-6) TaxID=627192 RepID=UPI0002276921|nr:hypothetical protein [Sphingobium sp. SYK-6]BAK65353.1 hypothetical protein SLG_06780 [Sphingobium sp. SYK-6]